MWRKSNGESVDSGIIEAQAGLQDLQHRSDGIIGYKIIFNPMSNQRLVLRGNPQWKPVVIMQEIATVLPVVDCIMVDSTPGFTHTFPNCVPCHDGQGVHHNKTRNLGCLGMHETVPVVHHVKDMISNFVITPLFALRSQELQPPFLPNALVGDTACHWCSGGNFSRTDVEHPVTFAHWDPEHRHHHLSPRSRDGRQAEHQKLLERMCYETVHECSSLLLLVWAT